MAIDANEVLAHQAIEATRDRQRLLEMLERIIGIAELLSQQVASQREEIEVLSEIVAESEMEITESGKENGKGIR